VKKGLFLLVIFCFGVWGEGLGVKLFLKKDVPSDDNDIKSEVKELKDQINKYLDTLKDCPIIKKSSDAKFKTDPKISVFAFLEEINYTPEEILKDKQFREKTRDEWKRKKALAATACLVRNQMDLILTFFYKFPENYVEAYKEGIYKKITPTLIDWLRQIIDLKNGKREGQRHDLLGRYHFIDLMEEFRLYFIEILAKIPEKILDDVVEKTANKEQLKESIIAVKVMQKFNEFLEVNFDENIDEQEKIKKFEPIIEYISSMPKMDVEIGLPTAVANVGSEIIGSVIYTGIFNHLKNAYVNLQNIENDALKEIKNK